MGVNPDAKLVRIDYVRGNRSPTAVANAKNTIGREPLSVSLSAAQSTDKDEDALEYHWSVVEAGNPNAPLREIANTVDAVAQFDTPGVYTIRLEVKDQAGAVAVTSLPAIVGNATPTVEFTSPRPGDFFTPGETVSYDIVVSDREDGTSDLDLSEEPGWRFIEASAPSRLRVEAIPVTGGEQGEVSPGLTLIRQSDCLNCHAVNRALVGPSFLEVANKYRDDPHQLEKSVQRVMEGSSGVWGKVGMLPHQSHTRAEVQQMVEYVYSQTAESSHPSVNGFRNNLPTSEDSSGIRLSASYTDLGRGEIPKLSGQAEVLLRSRNVQAEFADAFAGTQVLNSDRAQGKKFMGAIEHNGFLKFESLRLDQFSTLVLSVASAGAGGEIEVRRTAIDGPLLGSVKVEVNGEWESFYETSVDLKTGELQSAEVRDDLYLVFKNVTQRSGLMNIDAIKFQP